MGDLSRGEDYANFRAWTPRRIVTATPGISTLGGDPVGGGAGNDRRLLSSVSKLSSVAYSWVYFDWGPKGYAEPIICLHGIGGSADAFFYQVLHLGGIGYRVISVQLPPIWTIPDFCDAFQGFLDSLGVKRIHLYGTGLGGYLAFCYAGKRPERVASIVVTHAFLDPARNRKTIPYNEALIKWLPEFLLRRIVLSLLPQGRAELRSALAAEFVIVRTLECTRDQLASRLVLSIISSDASRKVLLSDERMTMIDTLDRGANLDEGEEDIIEQFPGIRRAYLKTGGSFPYLSQPEEVNMHLVVHLRRNAPVPLSPVQCPPPSRHKVLSPEELRRTRAILHAMHRTKGVMIAVAIPGVKHESASDNKILSFPEEITKARAVLPQCDGAVIAAAVVSEEGDVVRAMRLIASGSMVDDYGRPCVEDGIASEAERWVEEQSSRTSPERRDEAEVDEEDTDRNDLSTSLLETYVNPRRDRHRLPGSGPAPFDDQPTTMSDSMIVDFSPRATELPVESWSSCEKSEGNDEECFGSLIGGSPRGPYDLGLDVDIENEAVNLSLPRLGSRGSQRSSLSSPAAGAEKEEESFSLAQAFLNSEFSSPRSSGDLWRGFREIPLATAVESSDDYVLNAVILPPQETVRQGRDRTTISPTLRGFARLAEP
uniref:Maspardin n=1 Tax=Compsopogon caeruleus TaxID=31354 RepID=A0A7S1XHC6_9RHOD|mmetsp:Transcript_8449/g.17160  ORF Transcript_8449/g.17160 Transcript_8449/m.17160 type:complete len:655 (+) Transcript_8449:308-2272(+)|eukprot:CAMPEP_0184685938 /NCGR_PEP_ID=MMETSP0312-20130426/20740_1 /TAXON_ID=31354 /ORGANISM="Compsopogon coeruleus, Strain SAG 36.94" /LENGTH=654 /DNA_ID=CAMNT_0027140539 /DNA_START=192 /DNA_END=2156 /DNA_ORIENTATION=-